MVYTASGVVSYGFPQDDTQFTYLLSGLPVGTPGINVTAGDSAAYAVEGLAVTLDTSAASTMKLAGDGDPIHGRIKTAENRAVLGIFTGSVQRTFKERMPAVAGANLSVGDSVVGGGNGLIKKAPSANRTLVVEVFADGSASVELL